MGKAILFEHILSFANQAYAYNMLKPYNQVVPLLKCSVTL